VKAKSFTLSVTIRANCCNIKKSIILPEQCIYVIHTILVIKQKHMSNFYAHSIHRRVSLTEAHYTLSDVRTKSLFIMHDLRRVNHTRTIQNVQAFHFGSQTRLLQILYNYKRTIGGSKLGKEAEQVPTSSKVSHYVDTTMYEHRFSHNT
jgi:hypothetical protein